MSQIYREIILDYYRNPRNYGSIEKPDVKSKDYNPSCGDVIEVQMEIDGDGTISDIKFNGEGCAISQASVSMLTEKVLGKDIDYLKDMEKGDVLDLLGIEVSATRRKCALLGYKVAKAGLYDYLAKDAETEE